MPEAVKRAPELSGFTSQQSALGENTMKYLHVNRLTGVHVYQGERGGWYFDLSFKDLPAGVPNIIGQPVAFPLETREQAIDGAVSMIAVLINRKDEAPAPEEGAMALFPFDDVVLQLPSEMIEAIKNAPIPPPEPGYARTRLDEIRDEVWGGGPLTAEIMDRLDREQRARVLAVVAMAICEGIVRWPQFEEGVPKSKRN
jgi:hypothetical protein